MPPTPRKHVGTPDAPVPEIAEQLPVAQPEAPVASPAVDRDLNLPGDVASHIETRLEMVDKILAAHVDRAMFERGEIVKGIRRGDALLVAFQVSEANYGTAQTFIRTVQDQATLDATHRTLKADETAEILVAIPDAEAIPRKLFHAGMEAMKEGYPLTYAFSDDSGRMKCLSYMVPQDEKTLVKLSKAEGLPNHKLVFNAFELLATTLEEAAWRKGYIS